MRAPLLGDTCGDSASPEQGPHARRWPLAGVGIGQGWQCCLPTPDRPPHTFTAPWCCSPSVFVLSSPQVSAQPLQAGAAAAVEVLAGLRAQLCSLPGTLSPRSSAEAGPASSPKQQMLEFTTNLTTEGSWRCQPCCPDRFCPPSTSGQPSHESSRLLCLLGWAAQEGKFGGKAGRIHLSSDNELLVQHGSMNNANLEKSNKKGFI